jgi:hypothetical protein
MLGDRFENTSPQIFSDQFSNDCSRGNSNPYAGMNPLVCKGVQAPVDSYGRCSLAGMRLLRKMGNTCYYCQAINPPIQGIIVPMDQIASAGQQGFKCGIDQASPNCYAICMGGGSYIPQNQGPPKPTARAAPASQSSACQPFGPGGYDYCANPAGTQPAGCVCGKQGSKGMYREPAPPQPAPKPTSPANMTAIDKAMNSCMSEVVPYWHVENVQPEYLAAADNYAGENHATTIAATIREEIAMALQAQAARASQYGAKNAYNQTDATDYMVGWLDHCLYTARLVPKSSNLSPNDPRLLYSQFLGVSLNDRRIDIFGQGWGDVYDAPLPMLPPGKTVF